MLYDAICDAEDYYYQQTSHGVCFICTLLRDMFSDGATGLSVHEVLSFLNQH